MLQVWRGYVWFIYKWKMNENNFKAHSRGFMLAFYCLFTKRWLLNIILSFKGIRSKHCISPFVLNICNFIYDKSYTIRWPFTYLQKLRTSKIWKLRNKSFTFLTSFTLFVRSFTFYEKNQGLIHPIYDRAPFDVN